MQVIEFSEELLDLKKYVIQRQLLRSGTSIGANVREAQNAESLNDFIHKFKIAAKEADETEYWLLLCNRAEKYPSAQHLLDKLIHIKRIINSIIVSSKIKAQISYKNR